MRLGILVALISYLFGHLWLILVSIEMQLYSADEDFDGQDYFYSYFQLDTYGSGDTTVLALYYSFTTLSTVGFGDFRPRSNAERVLMAVVFVAGVAVFSVLMDNFLTTVKNFRAIASENEESERLS